jgi:hypothetical protein
VSVGSAQLVDGEGIEIRGLSISDPGASGPQAELAYFDEIVCFCQTSLTELLKGEPEFSRILVRRPGSLRTLIWRRRPRLGGQSAWGVGGRAEYRESIRPLKPGINNRRRHGEDIANRLVRGYPVGTPNATEPEPYRRRTVSVRQTYQNRTCSWNSSSQTAPRPGTFE